MISAAARHVGQDLEPLARADTGTYVREGAVWLSGLVGEDVAR